MKIIGHIYSDFTEKFGIPRQSGLVEELKGVIVFEKEYRRPEALIGIEEFSHLWLIWQFSENVRDTWSPTVRPPRLGGNEKKGVFATRSPFRPNPIGLSCVKLEGVYHTEEYGTVLLVGGIDMMNQTPLYDIKPYLPYTDCVQKASGGFGEAVFDYSLHVTCSDELLKKLPPGKRNGLIAALKQDPRPAYQDDPERIYGMSYGGFNIKFKVENDLLTIIAIDEI